MYRSFYNYYSIFPAIFLFLFFGIPIFLISRRLLRDLHLAGLTTLAGLAILFPLTNLGVPLFPIVIIIGLGLIAVRTWRRTKGAGRDAVRLPANFTYMVNVTAIIIMVAVAGKSIIDAHEDSSVVASMTAKTYASLRQNVATKAPSLLPHIVHIVLDGYSRADVLRDVYGFDNTPFLEALGQRGFHIANHATTPFNQTLLVMSSIHLLRPVTETDLFRGSATDGTARLPRWNNPMTREILGRSVRHGIVTRILHDLGYEIGGTPTTYLPLQFAHLVSASKGSPFIGHFARPEAYIFGFEMLKASPILRYPSERVLAPYFSIPAINYENLKELPRRRFESSGSRPRFIFEHILAPHPPFNIAADGARTSYAMLPENLSDGSHLIFEDSRRRAQYRDAYLNKLQYVNGAILAHIDRLKETLDGPLVIILHGDHGGGLHLNQEHLAKTCASERFKPLFAVFATDDAVLSEFTDDFNIVNTYRALFRTLLKADLPDLPNRNTYISWKMDETATIDPSKMDQPCRTQERQWTAERIRKPSQDSRPAISR
jgi:Sulfatase